MSFGSVTSLTLKGALAPALDEMSVNCLVQVHEQLPLTGDVRTRTLHLQLTVNVHLTVNLQCALLPFICEHSPLPVARMFLCGAVRAPCLPFPAGHTGAAQDVLMDSELTLGSSWQGRAGCCCLCCDHVKCCFSKPAPSVHTCLDTIQSSAVFAGHCFRTNRDKNAPEFPPCPIYLAGEERKAAGPAGFAPELCCPPVPSRLTTSSLSIITSTSCV